MQQSNYQHDNCKLSFYFFGLARYEYFPVIYFLKSKISIMPYD